MLYFHTHMPKGHQYIYAKRIYLEKQSKDKEEKEKRNKLEWKIIVEKYQRPEIYA